MRRTSLVLATMLLTMGLTSGSALARHSHDDPIVPPHQHWINGQRVGPNACADGPSIQFDHFHLNVHVGEPGFGKLGMVSSTGC